MASLDLHFFEALRYVASIISGLATWLSPWLGSEVSKSERKFLATFVTAITLIFWPIDCSYCRYSTIYPAVSVALFALAAFSYFQEKNISVAYGFTQKYQDGDQWASRTVLGGPTLTPEASAMANQLFTRLSEQEIFEQLNYDPWHTWERKSRTRLILRHHFWDGLKLICFLSGLVAALAAVVLWIEIRQSHLPLVLEPSTDQIMLEARSLAFKPIRDVCCAEISWAIEGPSAAKASGELGEISATGIYSSPLKIKRDIDLYVVATPRRH